MILTRYLLKRLFLYFFLLNGTLAFLYNLVEFFEKLMRIHHTSLWAIIYFILLNIFPTFFELIPLTGWVASALLIREIYERGEWESILLIGISPFRLLRLFLIGGLAITFLSFVGKEIIITPISEKAERIRFEEFKHNEHINVYDQWVTRDESCFIHFDFLDLTNGNGKNITLLYFRPDFTIEKEVNAPEFKLHSSRHVVQLFNASSLSYDTAYKETVDQNEIQIPSLFLYLQTIGGTKRLSAHIRSVIEAYNSPIPYFFNQELGTFFERLLKHVQPLFYYVTTLFLFLQWYEYEIFRWIVILLIYPYLLISTNATIFLVRHNSSAFLLFIPYIIVALLIITIFFSQKFRSFLKLQIEKK